MAAPGSKLQQLIRPTSDRVREALFNILGERVLNAMVLDLYAGTGALGLESLSREAKGVVFVDSSSVALQLINRNLHSLFSDPQALLVRCRLDAPKAMATLCAKLPPQTCFDLILLDPPYQKGLALQTLKMVEKAQIMRPDGTIVAEEHDKALLPNR
jgi:16S rRNA (guanine966-N2)-methyltransferase